jgi:hypothetical protein
MLGDEPWLQMNPTPTGWHTQRSGAQHGGEGWELHAPYMHSGAASRHLCPDNNALEFDKRRLHI